MCNGSAWLNRVLWWIVLPLEEIAIQFMGFLMPIKNGEPTRIGGFVWCANITYKVRPAFVGPSITMFHLVVAFMFTLAPPCNELIKQTFSIRNIYSFHVRPWLWFCPIFLLCFVELKWFWNRRRKINTSAVNSGEKWNSKPIELSIFCAANPFPPSQQPHKINCIFQIAANSGAIKR